MNSVKMPGFTGEASLYMSSEHYRAAGAGNGIAASPEVLPQLRTIWTTADICEACGCSVSGFQCNCGLRPDPRKVECINNGGPSKLAVFDGGALRSSISRSKLA